MLLCYLNFTLCFLCPISEKASFDFIPDEINGIINLIFT
ncbi:hypothetical protein KIS1582_2972 [Cytobacillus firmus]|uniref:Uncharacterized protein n=1 Tax=Cytobacillus firmus TaxID=1399 RepID=A0A800MVP5_CYTFI|nr:hypothetical protein KIS1582_2972 [Cytobacillus firmus]